MQFHETVGGKRFFQGDVPAISNSLRIIAEKLSGKVEYDLIPETELISVASEGWKFVTQLQSGLCLVEKSV